MCGSRNVEFVRGLGADEVVDYTKERFEELIRDVDVVFDTMGGQIQRQDRPGRLVRNQTRFLPNWRHYCEHLPVF